MELKSNLKYLVALQALLETNSVTKAAKQLNITQAAMSNILKQLRLQLDDDILVRDGQRMIPTRKALTLIEPVNDVLRDVEHIFFPRSFDPATATRTYKIATIGYVETVLFPPLLNKIEKIAPNIKFDVFHVTEISSDNIELIKHMDLTICIKTEDLRGFSSEYLFSDQPLVAMSKDNPLTKKRLTVDLLMKSPHIAFKISNTIMQPFERKIQKLGIQERNRVVTTPHPLSALSIIMHTNHLCVVGGKLLEALFQDKLHYTDLPKEVHPEKLKFDVYQLWHKKFETDLAHAWLRQQVLDVAKTFSR